MFSLARGLFFKRIRANKRVFTYASSCDSMLLTDWVDFTTADPLPPICDGIPSKKNNRESSKFIIKWSNSKNSNGLKVMAEDLAMKLSELLSSETPTPPPAP